MYIPFFHSLFLLSPCQYPYELPRTEAPPDRLPSALSPGCTSCRSHSTPTGSLRLFCGQAGTEAAKLGGVHSKTMV